MKDKQLKFGALISYVTIAFNIAAGLLYTPWLIRTVGDAHYAMYTIALSVINIFLMDFGIGSAVTKFLSNYYAQKRYEEADRFMGIVYKTFIAISAAIALALLVFFFQIDRIYTKFSADELAVFKRLFLVVAAYSVFSFPCTPHNGLLLAGERFIELKLCALGQKVLDVALVVVFLLLGKGIYALVLVHAFSNLVFLIVRYLLARARIPTRADMTSWDGRVAKDLFGFSAWHTVMSLARRCIYNIMPTVIAALSTPSAVTMFSVAAVLEGYVFTFTDAVNGMFMPRVSRIMNDGSEGALERLMTRVARFHIYTLGLLMIGFLCVGRQFVGLWLGRGYEMVFVCAAILIAPGLVETPQQIARTTLLVKDVVKEQAILYVAMAAVNLVLAFLLLPPLGVLGAAISVGAAYVLKVIGLNVMYRKYLKIRLWQYFKDAYGRWLLPAAITLIVGLWIDRVLPLDGWIGLLAKAGIIAVIYGALILLLTKDEDLVGLLRRLRGRK